MAMIAQMTKHSLAAKGRKSKRAKMKAETEIEGAAETKEGKEENEQQSTQKHQEKNKHVQPNYLCCICCMSAPIDPNGLTID